VIDPTLHGNARHLPPPGHQPPRPNPILTLNPQGLFAALELNRTDLQQVDPVNSLVHAALSGHARQRRDLIDCSETRTVGARSVQVL